MTETRKAHERRVREGWYDRWCPMDLPGLDVGCGDDPIRPTYRRWDLALGDGDATRLVGLPDAVFQTVYSSHLLEHLDDPDAALREWWRVLRPGGHLIVVVPSRTLYEGRWDLPSRWNEDHKTYWLPETAGPDNPPHTRGLRETLTRVLPEGEIVSLRVLDEGHAFPDKTVHPVGEYSLEGIVRKP